jgi:apolipoprotein N-acyltransferase
MRAKIVSALSFMGGLFGIAAFICLCIWVTYKFAALAILIPVVAFSLLVYVIAPLAPLLRDSDVKSKNADQTKVNLHGRL